MRAEPAKQVEPAKWTVNLKHPTYRIKADECPVCHFPEAVSGYCENCGWTGYDPSCPHCRKEQGK